MRLVSRPFELDQHLITAGHCPHTTAQAIEVCLEKGQRDGIVVGCEYLDDPGKPLECQFWCRTVHIGKRTMRHTVRAPYRQTGDRTGELVVSIEQS